MKIAFVNSKAEVEAHYMVRMWQSMYPPMRGGYTDDSTSVDLDQVFAAKDLVELAVADGRFSSVDAESMHKLALDFLFMGGER